jgi:hypothetical protein
MTGSETFIIVAFRCSDRSRPRALASAICATKNVRSAFTFMTEASRISPSMSPSFFLSTVVVPSELTNSIETSVASLTVVETSLP